MKTVIKQYLAGFLLQSLALAIFNSISGKMPPSPDLLFQLPWLLLNFKAQNFTVCFKLAYFYYLSCLVYLEAHLEKSQFV